MNREEFVAVYNTPAHNNWEGRYHQTYGQWMLTHTEEFFNLVTEIDSIKPKKILEIGTNHGGSAIFWDHIAGPGGQVVTLDTPELVANHHPVSMLDERYGNYLAKAKSDLTLLLSRSNLPETVEKVKEIFKGPIDFVFIDGDHSYKWVKKDYELYSPLVRKGGIIAFDDIIWDANDVGRFWNELEGNKKLLPVPTNPPGRGIGVLYV
jgi:predicted O-methyltransferase YrrM